jgi:quercetin dioxygenase-like cupin family protein
MEKHQEATVIEGQAQNGLPPTTITITTHDEQTGKAVVYRPPGAHGAFTKSEEPIDDNNMVFYTPFSTRNVPMDTDDDLDAHVRLFEDPSKPPPLAIPNGTIARLVDFAPGYVTYNHRTLSVDYGIVIEGTIELVLDSGEVTTVRRGGIVVQRGTMHRWRNPSKTEWTRMFFTLVSAQPRVVQGRALEEDLDAP